MAVGSKALPGPSGLWIQGLRPVEDGSLYRAVRRFAEHDLKVVDEDRARAGTWQHQQPEAAWPQLPNTEAYMITNFI